MNDINKIDTGTGNSNSAVPTSRLDSCKPTTGPLPTSSTIIRKPGRAEVFTTVEEAPIIAVVIDRKLDNWGNSAGEEYYPVTGDVQSQVGSDIRSVAFHPCVSSTGLHFICPQKLDPPHARVNSWNASLATALALPPGQWRTVWSDKQAECYQHDLVTAPVDGIPEYPSFQEDLEKALSPNIINSLVHPVIQQLVCKQSAADDWGDKY